MSGIDDGFTDGLLIGEGCDCADFGEEARCCDVDGFHAEVVLRYFGIEGGEGDDHRGEDCHGVGAIGKVGEEVAHVFVDHRVLVEE